MKRFQGAALTNFKSLALIALALIIGLGVGYLDTPASAVAPVITCWNGQNGVQISNTTVPGNACGTLGCAWNQTCVDITAWFAAYCDHTGGNQACDWCFQFSWRATDGSASGSNIADNSNGQYGPGTCGGSFGPFTYTWGQCFPFLTDIDLMVTLVQGSACNGTTFFDSDIVQVTT